MVGVTHSEQVLHLILCLTEIGGVPTSTQVLMLRIQIPYQVPVPYVQVICLLVYELVVQALLLT